jgi:neutral ceramidase
MQRSSPFVGGSCFCDVCGYRPPARRASRVEFTKLAPPPPTPPTGKYEHEKLFLRAIVLDNGLARGALISVDGAAPGSIPAKVAAELKCPIENVIASSTHSHSAGLGGPPPGTPGAAAPGSHPPQSSSPLDGLAVQAVREALAKLQPARVSFGKGMCYLNVNRDTISPKTRLWTQDANMTAPSDKTVDVVKFDTPAGDPIAFYINYAMHPINLYLGGIVSADFPGAVTPLYRTDLQ